MHQIVEGRSVYIVDLDTIPELPITGLTEGEALYDKALHEGPVYTGKNRAARSLFNGGRTLLKERITYAQALTDAIETGVITQPGKYAIEMHGNNYEIFAVIEEDDTLRKV